MEGKGKKMLVERERERERKRMRESEEEKERNRARKENERKRKSEKNGVVGCITTKETIPSNHSPIHLGSARKFWSTMRRAAVLCAHSHPRSGPRG